MKELNEKNSVFSSVEEAIKAFRKGEMLILIDDEERENEGDLIVAAEKVTPDDINFMTKYGRGLICTGITKDRARKLQLNYMVENNTALHQTAFTESIDAIDNTTTGISTFDRQITIQKLVDENAKPEDFARPGHVFPLIASKHGVLGRAGHTEAVVDLAVLSGMKPAGVLCEILKDDGTMARLPSHIGMSKNFGLKLITVGDIKEYRIKNEKLVKQLTNVNFPSKYGNFRLCVFQNRFNNSEHHVAMLKGEFKKDKPALVRIHSECLTGDVFGSKRCDCGEQLHSALSKIDREESGVLIYLRQEGRGIGLANKILAYDLQDKGKDTVEANEVLGFKADLREYWFAAQILKDIGINTVKLLTNNPLKVKDLIRYGIDVIERIPLIVNPNPSNEKYLRTKREKLGHLIHF